ncbi:TyeA family type III secretion system gatekeeper subunit [Pseudomonas sp. nanlin1]|uniref:TyeA family type III secretion system gatekeeper subunit n=1 Tax=Pseudomonas sp. nanlin1 TaxID=3040605 RepID=UPI00388FF35E
MPLERLSTMPPANVQTAAAQASAAPAAKATSASVHQHHESAHLAQLMGAALATASKALSQREVVCGQHASSQPMSLQQLLQGMANHGPAQLNAQLNKVRQQLRQQKSTKELLKDNGNSPLQTHLLLSEVAHQAKEQGNQAEAEEALEHLQALEAEHGEEIRAGLSVTPALTHGIQEPDLRDSLRKVYYQHLIKHPSLGNFIEAVLHLCGEDHFLKGLRALQQALADDIANLARQPQEGKLRSLMESLGRTRQLNNLVHGCSDLVQRMATKNPAMSLSALLLMRQLMQLANQSMNVRDTQQLSEKVGGRSPTLQLTFLIGLRHLLNDLPHALWRDDKNRQTSLRNLVLVMDELTQTERKALPPPRSAL